MHRIGEVRFFDDNDYARFKSMCEVHDGWKLVYNKNGVVVRTMANDVSDFSMFKIQGGYSDVTANTLYDVLHDPYYRKSWDPYILEGFDICRISPNSDIGYYAMKLVKPLMNRDFVTQRSWLDLGAEKFILNHSLNHVSMPPKKHFVRGISYITGYHVVATGGSPDQPGCFMSYVTQSDPRGRLPVWAVNMTSSIAAPKVMKRLLKACRGYERWKSQHGPNYKPWLAPEQNSLPQFDPADIRPMSETTDVAVIDERGAQQEETDNASGDELVMD